MLILRSSALQCQDVLSVKAAVRARGAEGDTHHCCVSLTRNSVGPLESCTTSRTKKISAGQG